MTLLKHQEIKEPDFGSIPEVLKNHAKWMLWKAEPKPNKPDEVGKVPYQVNGYRGSKNKPEHYVSFEEAKRAYEKGGFDGIGVVINRNDNLVCIDLDDIEDINHLDADKKNWVQHSYTEYSPSENGLHLWVRGQKPEWIGTKKNGIEMYGSEADSFLTVTGNIYTQKPIMANQSLIISIAEKYFSEEIPQEEAPGLQAKKIVRFEQPDNVVINKMFNSKRGKEIKALFSGDFGGYASQSEADQALCNHLAYWTNSNAEQMDRLFRASGLYRDKWDEKRPKGTYGAITIEKAINDKVQPKYEAPEASHVESEEDYYIYNKQGQLKFNTHLVKSQILNELPTYRSDIGILQYENGVYKRVTKDDIKYIIQNKIKEEATTSRKQEITELILHENKSIPLSDFNSKHKILNVKNGIYDIKNSMFQNHTKHCLWTIQLPVNYNPEAKCPNILDFLHDILDEESVQFLIEWIAYMTLPYSDPDKVLFLHGSGGNGKGVLINILQHFLGYENISNMSLNDLEEDKFSRAHLYGKLGNICGDIDNRVISNTGIIKSLTGGDSVYAQFKGIDGFNFKSFAKLMFSANELPMSKDKTHGWFRRLFILPFDKTIPEEKKIARSILDAKLTSSEELSGLLNLVIEAIHRLERNGFNFTIPQRSKEAIEEYKYNHDKVEQFIQEEGKRDSTSKETLKQFYLAYEDWCRENGIIAEQKRKVKDKLNDKGFRVEKGTDNKVFVFGFSFNEDSVYNPIK